MLLFLSYYVFIVFACGKAFGTWAGIWVGVFTHPPAAGLPPMGLSFWVLPRLALYGLLLVGGPRASHKASSVEEGWWAPLSGPLGSWAGPGGGWIGGTCVRWGHSCCPLLALPPARPSYVSSFCALLSFYHIELHGLPIPNAVQKLPGVVSLNSCLVNKDILLCVIPVDESVTIAHVEPFDSAQDLDCFSTGDQFQDHCLYFTY